MKFNPENKPNPTKKESRIFGSDADKKYKLLFICTKSDLLLSPRAKEGLINVTQILDLNMFATPEELTLYFNQELETLFDAVKIPNIALISISRIMLAKNF